MATITQTPRPDPFAEADLTWELERLYQDLARVKGKPLQDTEKRYLRGLLCGYGPRELAKIVYRQSKSLTSYLSRTVYQYVKDLTGHNNMQNHSQIPNWLENYKKPRAIHFPPSKSEGFIPLEIVFNIENLNCYFDGEHNTFNGDVHFHFEAALPKKNKGGVDEKE